MHGPNGDAITFRELLTHRSGFHRDNALIFTDDAAAREQIAAGVQVADKSGPPEYNNINFSIARDLLPPTRPGRTRVTGPRVNRPCATRRVRSGRAAPMLYYPSPGAPGAAPAPLVAGQRPLVGPAACSSGGWFMTHAAMLRVLRGLDNGTILPAELKRAMDEGCLGWDQCSATTRSHFKSGVWGDTSAGFETFFDTLGDVPVVVVTNSPGPWRLDAVLMNAQITATTTSH